MAKKSWRAGTSALAITVGLGVVAGGVRAGDLPTGGSVSAGEATITAGGAGNLSIVQTTDRAIINWTSFSVGAGNSVVFTQPGASAATLNRVTGSMSTTVAGTVSANGRLYLVNPNGIQITGSGVVRAAGFTASTLDIGDGDFLAGRDHFFGTGSSAGVRNDGRIVIGGGGDAVLIGGRVVNDGTIEADGGRVGLAAGEDVSVDVEGDGFLTVSVPSDDADTSRALIEGAGRIVADGGRIEARAATSADLARAAINLSGSIEAKTVTSGRNGAVTFGAVVIDGGAGGKVRLSGSVKATGGKRAKGGSVKVLGREIELAAATIDVSGGAGGGAIRIGGDFAGGGGVPTATTTTVGEGTTLSADATAAGDGGSIVVWADGTTRFGGLISARGGAGGGNGGSAEVSGKAHLQLTADYESVVLADLRAPRGEAGTLLLDPGTVFILPSVGLNGDPLNGPDSFTDLAIAMMLAGGNLTIDTNAATGANGTAGDIILKSGINGEAARIVWSAGTTLTLDAARNIVFEAGTGITAASAAAGLVLDAGTGGSGIGTVQFASPAQVAMAGGAVDITYNPLSNPAGSGINGTSYTGATPPSEQWATFITNAAITANFLVNTAADLQNIRNNLGANYALGADIDASTIADFQSLGGEASNYLALSDAFTGRFDGRGHAIDRLTIDAAGRYGVGLFGMIGTGGRVEDVILTNATVTGEDTVGALAGLNLGTIVRTSSSGSVTATLSTAGGLVGQNSSDGATGVVAQSSSSATVRSGSDAGGLVGANYVGGSIADSFSTGAVTGGVHIGGLVGFSAGRIDRTYALGPVQGVMAGGVAGEIVKGSGGSGDFWDSVTTGQTGGVGVTLTAGTLGTADAAADSPNPFIAAGFDPAVWSFAPGRWPILAWQVPPPAVPTPQDITVVLTNASRAVGTAPLFSFRLERSDGTVIQPSDYALYLSGYDSADRPAYAGLLGPDAPAGSAGAVYAASGTLTANAGYRLVFVNGTEMVVPAPVVPPVAAPRTASGTITEAFVRTPTETIRDRVQGPQVSGVGLRGIFAPGGGDVSTIVTATIDGADGAAEPQDKTCFVALDESGIGTMRCTEAAQ